MRRMSLTCVVYYEHIERKLPRKFDRPSFRARYIFFLHSIVFHIQSHQMLVISYKLTILSLCLSRTLSHRPNGMEWKAVPDASAFWNRICNRRNKLQDTWAKRNWLQWNHTKVMRRRRWKKKWAHETETEPAEMKLIAGDPAIWFLKMWIRFVIIAVINSHQLKLFVRFINGLYVCAGSSQRLNKCVRMCVRRVSSLIYISTNCELTRALVYFNLFKFSPNTISYDML